MADYEKRLKAFNESNRRLNITATSQRNDIPKSAPAPTLKRDDHRSDSQENQDQSKDEINDRKDEESRVSYIDDYRLRQLLEELYRDKKYFDQFVDAKGILHIM